MIGVIESKKRMSEEINEANLFIGGVSSVINSKGALASKLNISQNDISYFEIIGKDIKAKIDTAYVVPTQFISGNSNELQGLTYYKDLENCTSAVIIALQSGINSKQYTLVNATSIANSAFRNSNPGLIYIPNVTDLGGSVGDTGVFQDIKPGCIIVCHPSLQTCNSGGRDGDIAYAEDTLGATIIYGENQNLITAPNAINDFSIGKIFGTAIQINFTPPTAPNAIDYYRIYADGVVKSDIKEPGKYTIGLTPETNYSSITVEAIDIYGNKSQMSNSQSVTTTTDPYPVSQIISYFKHQENANDSWGNNNAVATNVAYEDGVVGKRAIFNGTSSIMQSNSGEFDIFGTAKFSFVSLINLNALPASGNYDVLGIRQSTSATTTDKCIRIFPDGSIGLYVFDGSQKTARSSANAISLGNDIVVVGTFDGANLRIYANKILLATLAANGSFNFTTPVFVISNIGGSIRATNGKVDESSVWKTDIKESEIETITDTLLAGESLI